jgi:hypothetical protein
MNKSLHSILTTTARRPTSPAVIFWFCLSLAIALVAAVQIGQQGLASDYVVQDDARQHVFWMWRFLDPTLFPNDLIADYFQSVAPLGYATLYQLAARCGIDPLLFSKLLPPILTLLTTACCFVLSLQLLPIPATAFVATTLFNQNLWMRDDLASASPRAFLNLFFLAFLYFLLRRSLLLCSATILLLGLFYPQYVLVAAGVLCLRLFTWQNGRLQFSPDPVNRRLCLVGLGVAVLVMLPFALSSSEFGPTIDATQAKQLLEFLPNGRSRFFYSDFGRYWLSGGRSGIQPPLDPPLLCLGLLLPILLRYPNRFPLAKQIPAGLALLAQLTVVSLGFFFAAHALLFKLHLPSRYTQHSLRVVMAMAAAIALTLLIDALFQWANRQTRSLPKLIASGFTLLAAAFLLLYPLSLNNFPKTTYVTGIATPLYRYIAQLPNDSVIASLSEESSNLPTLTQRSILVGSEYAIPYHWGYYRQFRERVLALIQAQYSPNLTPAIDLIQQYKITHWLLDKAAFELAYVANNSWLRQYQPATKTAIAHLESGMKPALQQTLPACTSFTTDTFVILDANCMIQISDRQSTVKTRQ